MSIDTEVLLARIRLLERAIRYANQAVETCEGIGLLYCMGRASDEAMVIAAVLAEGEGGQ